MPVVTVTAPDDPVLEPYRNLKLTSEMRRTRMFVAEGEKLVQRLLRSRFRVHSVLVGCKFLASCNLDIPVEVTTLVVPDAVLSQVVGFKFHRGVLACGFRGAEQHVSAVVDCLDHPSVLESSAGFTGPENMPRTIVVVCIDIQDPTNLGTILRTAEAFGVTAVVLGGHCADPFSRRVLRVSMGAPFQLRLIRSADLAEDLGRLRRCGQMKLIAAVSSAEGEPMERVERADRLAILLGNESCGLDSRWVELCDRRVTIPMHHRADSLNVAVATGILLYHFCRPVR